MNCSPRIYKGETVYGFKEYTSHGGGATHTASWFDSRSDCYLELPRLVAANYWTPMFALVFMIALVVKIVALRLANGMKPAQEAK